VIASVYVIYSLVVMVASILLIRSVKKRDHTNMMMFMVMTVIGFILSFTQIYFFTYTGIFLALLIAVWYVYTFVCVYSLYDKFRNEKINGNSPGLQTVVYVQPGYQVPQSNSNQISSNPAQYPAQQYIQQSTPYGQQPTV
jgi:Ca2+/Na+ antiporter